jgi:hypothetical protein
MPTVPWALLMVGLLNMSIVGDAGGGSTSHLHLNWLLALQSSLRTNQQQEFKTDLALAI